MKHFLRNLSTLLRGLKHSVSIRRYSPLTVESLEDRLVMSAYLEPVDTSGLVNSSSQISVVTTPTNESRTWIGPGRVENGASYEPLAYGNEDENGLYLTEDEPLDDENAPSDEPTQISGAFLTGYGTKPMSFVDIRQRVEDVCIFASVLSAVARTNYNLASGIRLKEDLGNGVLRYQVRMFAPGTNGVRFGTWVDVDFDGTIEEGEMASTDPREYWPTLYKRAYLKFESEKIGGDYHDTAEAFGALTGVNVTPLTPNGSPLQAVSILKYLNAGRPIVADTRDGPRVLTQSGLIHNHGYTVLGIEFTSNNEIFVSLRNPWGRDTDDSLYDADHDGKLSAQERLRKESGLDGANDGLIRISWSDFSQNFDEIDIANITGPGINRPMDRPPVFASVGDETFETYAGEEFTLNLSATDPEGKIVTYSLSNDSPGYINPQSGKYTWEPAASDHGVYTITVHASSSDYDTSTLCFRVQVFSGEPFMSYLTGSPSSLPTDGSQRLTLTAVGVGTDVGHIDHVEFWRDANGDGFFQTSDIWLGKDENGADGWSYSDFMGAPNAGTMRFFARAVRYSFGDVFYSSAADTPVSFTNPPAATTTVEALDSQQQQASPTATGDKIGIALTRDGSGNTYQFWNNRRIVSGSEVFDAYMRVFSPAGTALTGAVLLKAGSKFDDVAMLEDGSFAAVYHASTSASLFLQRYSSDGSLLGPIKTLTTNVGDGVQIASDSSGNMLVVYHLGDYFAEDIYALTCSASGGVVTRAPWRVNSHTTSMQKLPTVALNANGDGVIAWTDFDQGKIIARRVTDAGLNNGSEFTVSQNNTNGSIVADLKMSSAINASGEFVIAYTKAASGSYDIFARLYNASGQPKASEFVVNTNRSDDQYRPKVALNDAGWCAFAWESYNQDSGVNPGTGIYAKIYDPQGAVIEGAFSVANIQTWDQSVAGLVLDDDLKMTFTWTHGGWQFSGDDITYVRRFRVNRRPQFPSDKTLTVPENSAKNTVVGMVTATDPDHDTVQYVLQGSSPFKINASTGQITVNDPSVLNYEGVRSFILTVLATDSFGLTSLKSKVNVNLTNVNEAPTVRGATFSVPELSDYGKVVGKVTASDPDGDAVRFSLAESSPFAIDSKTGVITVRDWLDLNYDTKPTYSLVVTATDLGSHAKSGSTNVTVNLVKSAPSKFFPTISEDNTTNSGQTVTALLGASSSGTSIGIAIVAVNGAGTWQYSLNNGVTWLSLAAATPATARLLRGTSRIRFLPSPNYNGLPEISFRPWNLTTGTVGGVADLSGNIPAGFGAMEVARLKVMPVNDAPVLATTAYVTTSLPNTAFQKKVSSLLSGVVTDADSAAKSGIAIVGASGAGAWAFSTDGGATWTAFGTPSASAARLLRSTDLVRFTPSANAVGKATLSFRAWDQTTGVYGQTANLGLPKKVGGATAFSSAIRSATIIINTAPTLGAHTPTLGAISEDAVVVPQHTVETLLGSFVTDPDAAALRGLAVVGSSGLGTWQFSTNGGVSWVNLGSALSSKARLLRGTDRLRFVPARDFNGTAQISFRAWDRTTGTTGSVVDLSAAASVGGSKAFSSSIDVASLQVTPVNDAPVLTATPVLSSTLPNVTKQWSMAEFLAGAVVDVDAGAQSGIAVIAASGPGTWNFSTDGGSSWTSLKTATAIAARMLRSEDLVQFVPTPNALGKATLSFRAWDQTTGTFGQTTNLSAATALGGTKAISVVVRSVVVAINTAPTLVAHNPTLPGISKNATTSVGVSVESLLGSYMTDANSGALRGIAVEGATGVGTWQYSLNGGATWISFGSLSTSAARLLRNTDRVRFIPTPGKTGIARLRFRGWDQTAGSPGKTFDLKSTGGSSAFSVVSDDAEIVVA